MAGVGVSWEADASLDVDAARQTDEADEFGLDSDEIPEGPVNWIDKRGFELFIAAVVVLNMVSIGLETDFVQDGDDRNIWWLLLECVFCAIFLVELALRIYYHTWHWVLEKWRNTFDAFVAIMALVDVAVIAQVDGSVAVVGAMTTVFRFVRLVRLLRMVRLLRVFPQLWVISQALGVAISKLPWIVMLMFLWLYVCAVALTMEVGQNTELYGPYRKRSGGWDHEHHFGSVVQSMFTLFQIMMLEDWADQVVRHVVANQPAMIVFFVIFIIVSAYGLLNLIVGVIVRQVIDSGKASEAEEKERKKIEEARVLDQMAEIFASGDADGSGTLTREEFEVMSRDKVLKRKMKAISLTKANAAMLFEALDDDGSGELSIDEFTRGCKRLHGPAMCKDILSVKITTEGMAAQLDSLEQVISQNERRLEHLDLLTTVMVKRLGFSEQEAEDEEAMMAALPKAAGHSPLRRASALTGVQNMDMGGRSAPRVSLRTRAKKLRKADLSLGNRPDLPPVPSF